MSKPWIYGSKIIITGASSGIGRELAQSFIREYSCKVIGVSRNEEKAQAVFDDFNSENYSYYCFDVGQENGWKKFVDFLIKIDFYPDIIINNAGVLPTFRSVDKTGIEVFEDTFRVDYWSAVYSIKYLSPLLEKSNKPAIINVSSSSALASLIGTAPYTSAKTALRAFTECYAREQKGKKYVSVVCPGFTKTNIFRDQKQGINEGIIGKISTPVDKMAKKIMRGIIEKKKRMVFGKDAHAMSFLYRLAPNFSTALFSKVIKKSGLKLFEEIFEEEK